MNFNSMLAILLALIAGVMAYQILDYEKERIYTTTGKHVDFKGVFKYIVDDILLTLGCDGYYEHDSDEEGFGNEDNEN